MSRRWRGGRHLDGREVGDGLYVEDCRVALDVLSLRFPSSGRNSSRMTTSVSARVARPVRASLLVDGRDVHGGGRGGACVGKGRRGEEGSGGGASKRGGAAHRCRRHPLSNEHERTNILHATKTGARSVCAMLHRIALSHSLPRHLSY